MGTYFRRPYFGIVCFRSVNALMFRLLKSSGGASYDTFVSYIVDLESVYFININNKKLGLFCNGYN